MELNPEQRRAVEAVRGPVCILAGAGSGKTTTITHRIAHQVATGAFRADEILAVTFTDKAAGELRARLEALGAPGVTRAHVPRRRARAAAPVRARARRQDRLVEGAAAAPDRELAAGAYRFRPAGDLATEIEWAKNRRITPERYRAELGDHEPPIPADLMHRVYRQYEERKAAAGYVDFEDLLELAIQLYAEDDAALGAGPRALPRVHRRRVPGRQPPPADAARALARRRATSSASSATTTSRSTRSPARRPSICSRCRGASRTRR